MNILDIIPEELLVETLSFLNYRDMLRMCISAKSLNDICEKNNIKKKIKYSGFPRETGHCNVINLGVYGNLISKIIICYDCYDCYDKYNKIYYLGKKGCKILTNMLINSEYKLIRGDLIFGDYNNTDDGNFSVYIFDGCKIIPFYYNYTGFYHLPKEFTIINNNVPYNYWFETNIYRGLQNKKYAWFDFSEVKNQCINNIKYEKTPSTSFIYNGKNYNLYFTSDWKSRINTSNLQYKFHVYDNLIFLDFTNFKSDNNTITLYTLI